MLSSFLFVLKQPTSVLRLASVVFRWHNIWPTQHLQNFIATWTRYFNKICFSKNCRKSLSQHGIPTLGTSFDASSAASSITENTIILNMYSICLYVQLFVKFRDTTHIFQLYDFENFNNFIEHFCLYVCSLDTSQERFGLSLMSTIDRGPRNLFRQ